MRIFLVNTLGSKLWYRTSWHWKTKSMYRLEAQNKDSLVRVFASSFWVVTKGKVPRVARVMKPPILKWPNHHACCRSTTPSAGGNHNSFTWTVTSKHHVYPEQRLRHFLHHYLHAPPWVLWATSRWNWEWNNGTRFCLFRRHGRFDYSAGAPGESTTFLVYIVGY